MTVTGSNPFPFITKEGSLDSFKTVGSEEFNSDFNYGDVITGSYPLSSSLKSDFFPSGLYIGSERKRKLLSLKNTFNFYTALSNHYQFSNDEWNKEEQFLRLISVPSIFYGQNIKKGSVNCKWYYSGSLIGELRDINGDGELIQTFPSESNGAGNVAGVVLYKEGFLSLTGSWSIHDTYVDNFDIYNSSVSVSPSWKFFMTTGSEGQQTVPSSSFYLDFDATEKIPTLTMLAKAEKGELNHSNNPTYVEKNQYEEQELYYVTENMFSEKENLNIKNIVNVDYDEEDPPFEKITYISKVAIYDKDKKLVGIAKMATPVRKRQNDNITFKIKLDL